MSKENFTVSVYFLNKYNIKPPSMLVKLILIKYIVLSGNIYYALYRTWR